MQHGAPNETLTCQTFEEQLSSRIWSIEVLLRDFLLKHARLERVNPRSNGIIFLNIQGDYAYRECNIEGQRLLGKVRIKFGQTVDLMDVVLAAHGADITKPYTDGRETIEKILKQTWSHSRTVEQEAEKAKGAFTKMLEVFDRLPDDSDGTPLLVPDTNVLIDIADFAKLRFSQFPKYCLLLTPTVLSEIDRLKTEHRNDSVRSKAQGLVRQLKEFRRRGSLLDGVPIKKNVSSIRTIAHEAKIGATLSWLDPKVPDDRILSSVVEAIRVHPRSPVFAVSRDINFQNKAEYAGIPFVEPVDSGSP